jgi:hypothetical protein
LSGGAIGACNSCMATVGGGPNLTQRNRLSP